MADEKERNRVYELAPDPEGKPVAIPATRDDEPESAPDADGKYYLEGTAKNVRLALRLASDGVEVYCAKCRAPLKVTPSFIVCTRNERHFSATLYRKP